MSTKVALVTGAGGFTGRYLVPALRAEGYRVVAMGVGPVDGEDTLTCDLTDPAAVRAAVLRACPTHVVHLAAVAFVGHGDPRSFYDVNVFGTLNLLEALGGLETPPRKVLVASSANVYGTPGVEVIDESVCPGPVNHYACSKLAMEHMVRTWFDRLPIVVTRPFNYTGVGQDTQFLIPKIVDHFKRRERVLNLGNLDVARDFSDVRDLVAAYVALLASNAASDVFNVCSGRTVRLRDLLRWMSEHTGHDPEIRVDPDLVRKNEIPSLCGDNSKLARLTGCRCDTDLYSTVDWMLSAE